MFIYNHFSIIQNLQMSPIPKTSQDQFLGLDFSYSKTTLVATLPYKCQTSTIYEHFTQIFSTVHCSKRETKTVTVCFDQLFFAQFTYYSSFAVSFQTSSCEHLNFFFFSSRKKGKRNREKKWDKEKIPHLQCIPCHQVCPCVFYAKFIRNF